MNKAEAVNTEIMRCAIEMSKKAYALTDLSRRLSINHATWNAYECLVHECMIADLAREVSIVLDEARQCMKRMNNA